MKTYISDLIPRIQRFSKKLDNLTLLKNQHWVVIDDIEEHKNVYIFRENNELLISQNGKVEKAKWEYLGHNSMLIDRNQESYLFKHGFFDENILALKIDGKNEYAFLVNETRFDKELNSLKTIAEFLNRKYLDPQFKSKRGDATGIEIGSSSNKYSAYSSPNFRIIDNKEEGLLFGRTLEIFRIEYDDGERGVLYLNKKKNQSFYYDKNSLDSTTLKNYYETFDSGVKALHYYLTTGKKLKEGFIVTYKK